MLVTSFSINLFLGDIICTRMDEKIGCFPKFKQIEAKMADQFFTDK